MEISLVHRNLVYAARKALREGRPPNLHHPLLALRTGNAKRVVLCITSLLQATTGQPIHMLVACTERSAHGQTWCRLKYDYAGRLCLCTSWMVAVSCASPDLVSATRFTYTTPGPRLDDMMIDKELPLQGKWAKDAPSALRRKGGL